MRLVEATPCWDVCFELIDSHLRYWGKGVDAVSFVGIACKIPCLGLVLVESLEN